MLKKEIIINYYKDREGWYLHHCTLLHKSQDDYIKRAILEDRIDEPYTIIIDGIGISDKAIETIK